MSIHAANQTRFNIPNGMTAETKGGRQGVDAMIQDAPRPGPGSGPAVVAGFDVTRTFVRVTGSRANGLVEFDFAIGDPDISVELIMPRPAFEAFCRAQRAEILTQAPPEPGTQDAAEWRWGLHQATHQRRRRD